MKFQLFTIKNKKKKIAKLFEIYMNLFFITILKFVKQNIRFEVGLSLCENQLQILSRRKIWLILIKIWIEKWSFLYCEPWKWYYKPNFKIVSRNCSATTVSCCAKLWDCCGAVLDSHTSHSALLENAASKIFHDSYEFVCFNE